MGMYDVYGKRVINAEPHVPFLLPSNGALPVNETFSSLSSQCLDPPAVILTIQWLMPNEHYTFNVIFH